MKGFPRMTFPSLAKRVRGRPVSAKTVAIAALAAVLLGSTAGCGGPDITRARLEASIGPTFVNLYNLQQHVQSGTSDFQPSGGTGISDSLAFDPAPHCTKGGTDVTAGGPGADWACLVFWPSPSTETLVRIEYEVTVQPNGCYTAQGPSTLVGQQKMLGADGQTHTNSLYEFDSCFDTTG
jgi:ABC-2 type transport system permease protein